MKKIVSLASIMLIVLMLTGCGVAQTDYDEIIAQRDALQAEHEQALRDYAELKDEYDVLKSKHDELVVNTADWRTLSETEKVAQLAQAEADRIAAEEAARIAEEGRVAAEKAVAEEAARIAEEEAALKAEEEKKGYNTGITFDNLSRNPDDYEGKKVLFTGEVLQVFELANEIQIRLATKANSWGGYIDSVVYIYFDSSLISSRILEGDVITVYGVARGLHSYTTVMGASVTLPLIEVEKIEY